MHRSSETIAALAAALAKAQMALTNPEKRADEPGRTFRYAPLSAGVDQAETGGGAEGTVKANQARARRQAEGFFKPLDRWLSASENAIIADKATQRFTGWPRQFFAKYSRAAARSGRSASGLFASATSF